MFKASRSSKSDEHLFMPLMSCMDDSSLLHSEAMDSFSLVVLKLLDEYLVLLLKNKYRVPTALKTVNEAFKTLTQIRIAVLTVISSFVEKVEKISLGRGWEQTVPKKKVERDSSAFYQSRGGRNAQGYWFLSNGPWLNYHRSNSR